MEGEPTLDLTGDVTIASGKSLTVAEIKPVVVRVKVAGLGIQSAGAIDETYGSGNLFDLGGIVGHPINRGIVLDASAWVQINGGSAFGFIYPALELSVGAGTVNLYGPANGVLGLENLRLKAGGVISDSDGNTRVLLSTGSPHVVITGDVDVTGTLGVSGTGALLLSRMTTAQRDALTAVNGMLIYNTTLSKLQGYEGGAWANLI